DQRPELRRLPQVVQRGPADRRHHHGRRDRRRRRGSRRRVHRQARQEAGRRLHRRCLGPGRQAHGPCRCDRFRRQGHRGRQVRRDGSRWRQDRPFAGRPGCGHRRAGEVSGPSPRVRSEGRPRAAFVFSGVAKPGRRRMQDAHAAPVSWGPFPHRLGPMKDSLRIALAQFDFPVGAVEANAGRIAGMIAEARDEYGADIVLFPELAISGYPPEDLLMRPSFLARCQQALEQVAAGVHGITAVVGWPESAGSVLYNAASVLRAGRIEATYRKRELPNYAVFDERRYFEVDPDGGPCVFEVEGVPVGVVVCEDLWFPEPIADAVKAGAQLVLVPNASPFERGKHAQRDALLAERTRETGAAVAYLNVVGGQDSLVFDGASVVADGNGTVHPAAAAFTDQWLVVDYDTAGRSFTPVQWMDDRDESM